jgi:AraC-like DNA-binding protein
LSAGRAPADVAHLAGYADQSHLHRQVKALAQTTPSAVATAPWLGIDDIAWPAPGLRA